MTAVPQTDSVAQTPDRAGLALRLALASGLFSIPLQRVDHLAGYATLTGEPDDYFRGWLTFRGDFVPVFDLNRIVCDQPTPENFGSRIILIKTAPGLPAARIGLLAPGVTDTISPDAASAEPLDLDGYLLMLYTLIPPHPAGVAN
jgi:chemotaxis signal transduction protein